MKFVAVDTFANSSAPTPTPVVLLVGYGNLLRSDDGVGPAVVSRLAEMFANNPLCACLTAHQLTPELAEQIVGADRVVFIDASVEQGAGKVHIRRLDPEQAASSPLGHAASPEAILALGKALYHRAPRAWSIAVGVANLAVGDGLSPAVARAANRLCRRLSYRIGRWCRFSDKPLDN
jgi:hydrogenase maturation protease